ncbi:rRNA adenine dimethylase [Candidatus Omnitrophus magneticus]|uniref:Ribosomal RNA small subunit methyltransferase A n=1 Tax=Candidatus Omnitrophus magneticus TaxID=1609969 RepID=A0A0F0CM31_9BACT|nr:rRNA adenine dimethylase [Candidatus Omnitrophus magneticus]
MILSELKHLWNEVCFRPNKKLGQNFLIDKNIRDKIINAIPLTAETILVEVGPGFGVMTIPLSQKCREILAVEKDSRIYEIMEPIFSKYSNIKIIKNDILETDFYSEFPRRGQEKVLLFGNIPYYITTPLLEKAILSRNLIKAVYLVMQKEVAERITAKPGSKSYGALTCYLQFFTKPKRLFSISKNCFYPSPDVESSLLELEILAEPSYFTMSEEIMFSVIKKAFNERRKKIINSLGDKQCLGIEKNRWARIFEECAIDMNLRAEDLSLKNYADISNKAVGEK